jgi:hypothetical protein
MREEGLIARHGNRIILIDAERMHGWGRQALRSS